MPPSPRSGMSYKGENNATEAVVKPTRAGGGISSATQAAQEEELTPIDFQDAQGNEFLNEMIKGGQTGQAQENAMKAMPLPPEVRWRMLASNDIQILAGLIYSHCSPSETVTKEMLAVGSVYFNRWMTASSSQDAQKEFGGSTFQALSFDVQKKMPLYYESSKMLGFSNAAKFGANLPSEGDVKTATAAFQAAEQIYSGVNPFPHKFMYMDISAGSSQPDKVNAQTHFQYGKLHFWAARSQTRTEEQAEEQKAQGPLASTAAEPLA